MHNPTNINEPGNLGQGANSAKSNHAGAQSSVSREFHNFLADIEDLIKETTSLTGDDLARARVKLNARIASAKASAENMGETVVQRARQTANVTNAYVHEKPWKAVGASAAIAFLFGLVIARRS